MLLIKKGKFVSTPMCEMAIVDSFCTNTNRVSFARETTRPLNAIFVCARIPSSFAPHTVLCDFLLETWTFEYVFLRFSKANLSSLTKCTYKVSVQGKNAK